MLAPDEMQDISYKIDFMKTQDSSQVAELTVASWRRAYKSIISHQVLDTLSTEPFLEGRKKALSDPGFICLVARDEENGKVLGFSDSGKSRTEPETQACEGEIYALYVDYAYHMRGIGRSLLETHKLKLREAGYRKLVIWVLEKNAPAREFYCRTGGMLTHNRRFKEIFGEPHPEVQYAWNLE